MWKQSRTRLYGRMKSSGSGKKSNHVLLMREVLEMWNMDGSMVTWWIFAQSRTCSVDVREELSDPTRLAQNPQAARYPGSVRHTRRLTCCSMRVLVCDR